MSNTYESNLARVSSLLAELSGAWENSGGRATELVMELADPLQRLSHEPAFREAFVARFREMFEGTNELAGMEDLCHRLAPACTWCLLFVISDLRRERE